jgi:alkylmercury lyase
MSEQTCDCCEITVEQSTEHTSPSDRWLAERPVTKAPLPQEMARRMDRFFDRESVETLADFITAARNATGGGSISVDDLCHAAAETPHRAIVEGETYHFQCFYDGIALAHLVDKPVEIRTESPTDEPVTMQASPDGDISVTPPDAAMSFGVATVQETLLRESSIREAIYEAICPSVKAFSGREPYERWAEEIDAATVGMPLAAGVPVAAALTE